MLLVPGRSSDGRPAWQPPRCPRDASGRVDGSADRDTRGGRRAASPPCPVAEQRRSERDRFSVSRSSGEERGKADAQKKKPERKKRGSNEKKKGREGKMDFSIRTRRVPRSRKGASGRLFALRPSSGSGSRLKSIHGHRYYRVSRRRGCSGHLSPCQIRLPGSNLSVPPPGPYHTVQSRRKEPGRTKHQDAAAPDHSYALT